MDISMGVDIKNSTIGLEESICSDGMCCFTCVIPENDEHIGFFKFLYKRGTGSPYVKLLVTSEGYKNELYDSCKFLNVIISENSADSDLRLNLRCNVYKHRPKQCIEYPDRAGDLWYHCIEGPCIFNEYAAPSSYKKLVYKREWNAFYAIQDNLEAIQKIYLYQDARVAREKILKAKDVYLATISVRKKELDYILIPIPRQTKGVLYLSEKHQQISTISEAYHRWEEKIQKNLQNHYQTEWETKLKIALETEEKDARKRNDEDTTGNFKC